MKQFKTGEDLYSFLVQLQKRGLEKMLKGELEAHSCYEKHEKTTTTNARNGFSSKKIKSSFGEAQIQVPRDIDASFNPVIILTDLKARGVQDILITATDNLNGFTQTVKNVFLESQTQICVVH